MLSLAFAAVLALELPDVEGGEVFRPTTLSVTEEDGVLKVLRDGKVLVDSIAVERGVDSSDVKSSCTSLADGTRVWNRWSEVKDRRFRLEVAERTDGAIEITMTGQADADSAVRDRLLNVDLPAAALDGKPYECVAHSYMDFSTETGRFDCVSRPFFTRFLSADGLTWDFNPLGVGDSSGDVVRTDGGNQLNRNGVVGKWLVERTKNGYRFSSGDTIRASWGGFTGGKLVIREGTLSDYDRIHLMRKFYYHFKSEPRHLVAFGSPKRGANYAEGDVTCGDEGTFGWVDDPPRRTVVGHPEGAYYSAVSGKGQATYRFAGLPDGYYILDCSFGNYVGMTNRITLCANGERLLSGAQVPAGSVRVFSRAVPVRGGRLDLTFSGEWLVSTIGVLPLLGAEEDFSVDRGFWVSDGYEPCAVFRNADYRSPVTFGTYDETEKLPVPGTECSGTPRTPPAPVERPDPDDPRVAWMKTAKMKLLLANSVTLAEFDAPGSLARYLDREWKGKNVQAAMVSGMHSRHTYLGHVDRGIKALGRIAAELHRRGVKMIDHNDATLLWNDCAGFRVMMARLGETIRTLDGRIPSWQLCYSNPTFRETYYAYLRRLVEAGVDGFQIDELEFWRHGCSCRHCRDAFRRDTGWTIPLNECDAAWNDNLSPLRRRWQDWRRKTTANWYVELRRRVKDLRPDLALSNYITNDASFCPLPRRNASIDQVELRRAVNYFGTEMMTRSAMRNGRNLLPLARSRNVVSGPGLPPVWTWYYNVDYANNYFAWGLSMLAGQTPLLSDVPVPAGEPDFEAFEAGATAWRRPGSEPVAEIALLFAAYSRDWNEGVETWPETGVSFRPELFGTAQTMEAMHIPYEFIDDATLASGCLEKYKVLFLGEAQCLSDAEVAAVKAFAARGGTVRLSTRAGTRDEFGLPRTARPFDGLDNFVFADASHGAPFELRENWQKKVWELDYTDAEERTFRDEISRWAAKGWNWRVDAPDKVFTSIWREKDGAFVVQLLNGTGVNMRKGDAVVTEAPDPAFPPLPADVLIRVPAGIVCTACASSPDFRGVRRLVVEVQADGRRSIRLPRELVRTYALVRIREKEGGKGI